MSHKLTEAGIAVADIARVMGVSRQSASGWVNGHHVPHRFLAPRFERLLDLVAVEVEAGRLPLSETASRAQRRALTAYLLEQLTTQPTA